MASRSTGSGHGFAALLVLALVLGVVAGCSDDSGSGDESVPTVTVTGSTEASTDSTSTEGETTVGQDDPTSTSEDGAPPAADITVEELTGFTSPTGNIGCYIDAKSVRCDIAERDWQPPKAPADCELDYGQGITLNAGAAPEFVCAGDTAIGAGDPLPYGESIAAGLLRCESAESGMTCSDTETGRSFTISKEAYSLD